MVKELITGYKVKEISMELNNILQNDILVHQRARRLSESEQKEVNTQINK